MSKHIYSFWALILVMIILTSCSSSHTVVPKQDQVTLPPPTSGVQPTPTLKPTLPYTPTPIIVSTITPDQEQSLESKLQMEDCNIPCYLGISPSNTSWESAEKILENVGAKLRTKTAQDGFDVYHYEIWVGNSNSSLKPEIPYYGLISQDIWVKIRDDKVQQLRVEVRTKALREKYRDYWSKYLVEATLRRNGKPDRIFFFIGQGEGYNFYFVYNNLIAVNAYMNSAWKGDAVCPATFSEVPFETSNKMTLSSQIVFDSPYATINLPLRNRKYYLPIEEALGISEEEFYSRVLADPSTCFPVIKTNNDPYP